MFDDFYGLTGRPFQLTPDPKFYFESGTHRKALSYLGYGLAQSEGFIVITGEVGAGKSTLVAHLMRQIDRDAITVGQIVTSNLDGGELVHLVAQSFGLDIAGRDKASALGEIETFLHDEAREGRRCLLIVDESQNLSVEALEELRMLSNFQLGAHPLLQTLLLGQPEFRQVLAEHQDLEQLRQRVIAAHHLDPMEPGEIEPYVTHRLSCVGWNGNPGFDPSLFAGLYKATGGIPRRINQVATRLLLLGAVEQRTRIDEAMLDSVLREMRSDNALADGEPQHGAKVEPAPGPGPVKHAAYPHATVEPQADLAAALVERDAQIVELQQAVLELSDRIDASAGGASAIPHDISQRLASLEARLEEQEHSVRHVLTMLIEWFESGQPPRAAA